MSDLEHNVVIEPDDQGAPDAQGSPPTAPPAAEAPVTAAPAAATGSLLGLVNAAIDEVVDDDDNTKDLPVGKIHRLYARYSALDDDEIDDINKRAEASGRLAKKVGRGEVDIEGTNQRAAILLTRACQMLLWRDDDGDLVPLHEALAADGVTVDGPLRYDRRLVPLFHAGHLAGLPDDASSVQVVMALHRWGKDNNYAPLRGTAQIVELHASGLSGEALEAALAGN